MAYMSTSARQQAAKEWMKLQRMRFRTMNDPKGPWGTGGGEEANDSERKAQWAASPQGQYFKSLGGNAFEIAYRKKFYGGYRLPEGASKNSPTELAIYLEMTGQRNPYSSGGGGPGAQVTTGKQVGPGGGNSMLTVNRGTGASDPLFDFLGDVQSQTDAANAANEGRYQDILGQYSDLHERSLGRLGSLGEYQHMRAKEASEESQGATLASYAGRGMGDQAANVNARAARDLTMQQAKIDEDNARLQAAADERLMNSKLGFMERRTDQAPDYGQMMQMAQQYGLGGAGQYGLPGQGGQGGAGQNLNALYGLMQEPTYGVPKVMVGGVRQRRPRVAKYGGRKKKGRGLSRKEISETKRRGEKIKPKKIIRTRRPTLPPRDPYLSPFENEQAYV